jgi:hypothetical protein
LISGSEDESASDDEEYEYDAKSDQKKEHDKEIPQMKKSLPAKKFKSTNAEQRFSVCSFGLVISHSFQWFFDFYLLFFTEVSKPKPNFK